MIRRLGAYAGKQEGYTLIEVVISVAIGAIVMVGLTSVLFTSVRAGKTAVGRVEASSQIRNFEYRAYDDFARSGIPYPCATSQPPSVCFTLDGVQVSNSSNPVAAAYQVSFRWDGSAFLDRQVTGSPPQHMATSVTSFSWRIDGTPPNQTCVVVLTVTIGSYSESQTLRFYPRMQP